MTQQRDFKKLVRERIAKTGERYTTARAHVLAALDAPAPEPTPGLLAGYDRFGGSDVSVLAHALAFAGVKKSDGRPYTDALVAGLCGGIGFLYAVFEYKGHPPMLTIVCRSNSMSDKFIAQGLGRSGADFTVHETGAPATARKHLDAALDSGRPVLCTVDIAALPYSGMPRQWVGMGPHVVAAVGRDGDDLWLDDRAARPVRISMKDFAFARGAYKKAKHRLATLSGRSPASTLQAPCARPWRLPCIASTRAPSKASPATSVSRAWKRCSAC